MFIHNPSYINIAFDGPDCTGKSTLVEAIKNIALIRHNYNGALGPRIEIRHYSPKEEKFTNKDEVNIDQIYNLNAYMYSYIHGRICDVKYNKYINSHSRYRDLTIPDTINLIDRGFLSTFFYAYLDVNNWKLPDSLDTTNPEVAAAIYAMIELYIKFETDIKYVLHKYLVDHDDTYETYRIISAMETPLTIVTWNTHSNQLLRDKISKRGDSEVEFKDQYENADFGNKLEESMKFFFKLVYPLIKSKYRYVNPFIGEIAVICTDAPSEEDGMFGPIDALSKMTINTINDTVCMPNNITPILTNVLYEDMSKMLLEASPNFNI